MGHKTSIKNRSFIFQSLQTFEITFFFRDLQLANFLSSVKISKPKLAEKFINEIFYEASCFPLAQN